MAATIEKVLVIGMGKVGSLVGTLLHETGFQVTGMDAAEPQGLAFGVIKGDVTNPESLAASLKEVDAVVSCLPYDLNINVAHAAHAAGPPRRA